MVTRMNRIAALALMMTGLAGSAMAADPPETTVQFDLHWLSPPQVTPEGGKAVAQQTLEYTRLQGAANVGGSFTWPLRYAVEVQRYPILTLRYRARDLAVGPTYANRIMDVQLVDSGGRMNSLTVINYEDLVQDGTVHEIRKDLSQVPADAFIDQMRFNFQGATAGGRLDIYSITLDRGPNSPEPAKFEQRPVEFVVKDAAGNAVPDAEVHLGLLERSNWVALGSTDAAGRVVLPALAQMRPDGTIDPVEAVVEREGNLPQYVAPIKLPATGPIEVKLSPVAQAQQPAAPPAPSEPVQPAVQAEQVYQPQTVYYETPVYIPYPVYTYDYVYTYSTPGYWWVPTRCVRTRPVVWRDHDDRWREHHGDHHDDVPWYDHPRPETPPPHGPPPTRVPPPVRMDHGPGPMRWNDDRPNNSTVSNPRRDRDGDRPGREPGPIVAPTPRLQTPPDLHNRDDRGRPVMVNEPRGTDQPRRISTPPSQLPDRRDRDRDDVRRDSRDERTTTPPQRMDPGPSRDSTTRRPAPIVINIPERTERSDAPKARPKPVRAPEQRDPPARVQRDDQSKASQQERRVDPPVRIVPADPPARAPRDNDDSQRRQAQRDEAAQRAAAAEAQRAESRRDAMQRETAQRDQAARRDEAARRVAADVQRAESRRDAVQRETAQRDHIMRGDDSRRVAQSAPPTIIRGDSGRQAGSPADGNAGDLSSGNMARGSFSRR